MSGLWVALNILSTLWLSVWVSDGWGRSALFYADAYAGLVCAICAVVFLRSVVVAVGAVTAATRLHNRMLQSILYAKMVFFDTELTV